MNYSRWPFHFGWSYSGGFFPLWHMKLSHDSPEDATHRLLIQHWVGPGLFPEHFSPTLQVLWTMFFNSQWDAQSSRLSPQLSGTESQIAYRTIPRIAGLESPEISTMRSTNVSRIALTGIMESRFRINANLNRRPSMFNATFATTIRIARLWIARTPIQNRRVSTINLAVQNVVQVEWPQRLYYDSDVHLPCSDMDRARVQEFQRRKRDWQSQKQREKDPHTHTFSLTKYLARFTKGRFRPY